MDFKHTSCVAPATKHQVEQLEKKLETQVDNLNETIEKKVDGLTRNLDNLTQLVKDHIADSTPTKLFV